MPTTKERADEASKILASQLRQLLTQSQHTVTSLAAEVGWVKSKVSKIQNCRQTPTEEDIRVWCQATGNSDQIPELIAAVRNLDGLYVQWRRMEQGGLRTVQSSFQVLYEDTREFRIFQHAPIPSLLQTREYTTAHLTAIMEFRQIPDDVADATRERQSHQRYLDDGTKTFSFVVSEAALHAPMLPPSGMRAQLARLLEFTGGRSNVVLGILPLRAPRPVWPWEGFWIYDAREVRPDLVAGQVRNRQPSDVQAYLGTFERLAQASVYGREARALIEAAAP
ncbi:helix-turn-helix transcriptional regulator [Actinocorallia aurea]